PLRVCAFPKQNENAYLANFSNSLEARGALVDDFTFVRANRERYDIVHMHWPDTHLRTHSWWRAIGKHVRLGLTCALLRARGTRMSTGSPARCSRSGFLVRARTSWH